MLSSYEMLHSKYVNVFTFSSIVISITILLLTGMCPLNAMDLVSSGHIFIQNCSVMLCKVYNRPCKPSSWPARRMYFDKKAVF